jgi:hypothetical protein
MPSSSPSAWQGVDQLDVMGVFVEEVVADIEDFRSSLLKPVRAQRVEVQTAIETAYRRIQDAQAIVTGHLASVRRVTTSMKSCSRRPSSTTCATSS